VNLLLTVLLVVAGLLLLLLSLAGVAFGVFMAFDERNREQGIFFAIWLVPAVAASLGIVLRDGVTFTIGGLCFVIAGAALVLGRYGSNSKGRARSRRNTSPTGADTSAGVKKRPLLENVQRSLRAGSQRLLEASKHWFSSRTRTRK
jgi:hypothetical protein